MSNVNATELAQVITRHCALNQPCFTWGDAGLGKSTIHRTVAGGLGMRFVDYRLSQVDGVDIAGYKSIVNGRTISSMPEGLPDSDDQTPTLILFDEINRANKSALSAVMSLFTERTLSGGYRLPDAVRLFAAGNRQQDDGSVAKLSVPMIDRFGHYTILPDLDSWVNDFAKPAGIAHEVIGFHKGNDGAMLHITDPKRLCLPVTTPRGWESVSKILQAFPSDQLRKKMIAARIGDGPAAAFQAHLTLLENMVTPSQVLANPDSAPIPESPGVLYTIAEALARRCSSKPTDTAPTAPRTPVAQAWAAAMQYATRLPAEYRAVMVSSATALCLDLKNTATYIAFVTSNQ